MYILGSFLCFINVINWYLISDNLVSQIFGVNITLRLVNESFVCFPARSITGTFSIYIRKLLFHVLSYSNATVMEEGKPPIICSCVLFSCKSRHLSRLLCTVCSCNISVLT